MKRLLFLISLIGWLSMASSNGSDSLWGVWHDTTQADAHRLKAMDSICVLLMHSKPDTVLHLSRLAYQLAEAGNNKVDMANSLYSRGQVFGQRDNYKEALVCYQKMLKLCERSGYKTGLAKALSKIGLIYRVQGKKDEALVYLQKSLSIKEELGHKRGMAIEYNNIGPIYDNQQRYSEAMDMYTKSLKIFEEISDTNGIAKTYMHIGIIKKNQGNYDEALDYYEKSLAQCEKVDNDKLKSKILSNMGTLYLVQSDDQKALHYYKRSLQIGLDMDALSVINYNATYLYEIYKASKQDKKALEMHVLQTETQRKLNEIDAKEAIIKMELNRKYELDKKMDSVQHAIQLRLSEVELTAEKEKSKRQELTVFVVGGGLALMVLFALFIFNRLRITRRQKREIAEQKEIVEEQKSDITDSIRYAENIQQALLPTIESIKEVMPDGFVLFQPKDIVSGDFYWMQQHNEKVYLAVCDCTGHGVPGAFMSMIGSSLLDEAIMGKNITQPNRIFHEVRKGIINALKQTQDVDSQKDGMDGTLIAWDKQDTMHVAAAYNPVLIARNGELLETKADRQPVGFLTGKQIEFTHHEVKLEKGDTIYLFSDGYSDQFGGPKGKKFKMAKFRKLLLSIQGQTMNEQKASLETTLREWQGDQEQVDDILVMGIRF